jgi:hypothetical protein
MNDDYDLPIEKEKPKNKPKRGARSRWMIAWLALGLALSGVLVFLNAPRMARPPEPTPTRTWTPPTTEVTAFNAPVEADFSSSSVSALENHLAQVEWGGGVLRWRAFSVDDAGEWALTGGGLLEFSTPITQAAISPDGRWLLVQLFDGSMHQARFMRTDGSITQLEVMSPHAALSPDGRAAVMGDTKGRIGYYMAADSDVVISRELPPQSSQLRALALIPDTMAALDGTTIVRYSRLNNPTITTVPLLDTDQTYNALALLPNGEVAALTTAGVTVYDMAGGYRRYELDRYYVVMQPGALIASSTQPRLAVLDSDGVTVIRVDDGSPLTPDANQAAVTFWPMEGVKAAAFVDAFDLLAVSTSSGLHLMRDGQVVQMLPDEWPIDPLGQPSGR